MKERRQRKGTAVPSAPVEAGEVSSTMWTYPPRHILVAVDFGPASARALRVAAALAARHGSAITALHAETVEVPPYFTHDQLKDVERQHAVATRRGARNTSLTSSRHARASGQCPLWSTARPCRPSSPPQCMPTC